VETVVVVMAVLVDLVAVLVDSGITNTDLAVAGLQQELVALDHKAVTDLAGIQEQVVVQVLHLEQLATLV
jgi:hypothetical protein